MNKILNNSLSIKNINEKVKLYGWVEKIRKLGEVNFVDLRDESGLIQLVFSHETINFSKESIIEVEGDVIARKTPNNKLQTGEIEIKVLKFKILSNCETLPFEINQNKEINEDLRLKYRFLDLRSFKMQNNLRTRHKIIQSMHNFLNKNNFIEIETPHLGRITPEGARDFIVPTRKKGQFFALPQSPQLYKQLLMMSGFEKYYQIARAYRDETSRKDRQLEFSQLDIEMSFIDENVIINLVENLLKNIFQNLNIEINIPFKKLDYDFAMNNYGSDKPDLRYDFLLENYSFLLEKMNSNIFKNKKSLKLIKIPYQINKKQFKLLEEEAKKNHAKGLLYANITNNKATDGNLFQFFLKDLDIILENLKLDNFSYDQYAIFLISDDEEIVNQSLGSVRIKLDEIFNFPKKEYAFCWIQNWPLYEFDSETNSYKAAHHPFTMMQKKFIDTFDKDKKNARSNAYDIVLNGFEIGGGSIRINDYEIQKRMFLSLGLTESQIESQFGFFINAFKYAIPPHGGIALGIDRLVSILTKSSSIREVIAFPKNSKGYDPLTNSPSKIEDSLLEEYQLKLKSFD